MKPQSFDISVKLGEIGEHQVKEMLERDGWIIYRPQTLGSHPLDVLAINEKRKTIAADIKTKPRRTYYADTGVDLCHFEQYKKFSEDHGVEFYIYFVDRSLGRIYGNSLKNLEIPCWHEGRQYPRTETIKYGKDAGQKIRYWAMCAMVDFAGISQKTIDAIKGFEQRNYKDPVEEKQLFLDFNSPEYQQQKAS
jgi:hypothetical protein